MSRTPRALAAALVLAMGLTACSSGTPESTETTPETSSAVVSNGDSVSLTGTAALKWDPPNLSVESGEVTFELTALGAVHNLVIEELDNLKVVEAQLDQTVAAAVTLEPGTYTFYCDITGHRSAGMEGELVVS